MLSSAHPDAAPSPKPPAARGQAQAYSLARCAWLAAAPRRFAVLERDVGARPWEESEKRPPTAVLARHRSSGCRRRLLSGRQIPFAVGGVLLVRYSIERGWATPPVRMIMAAIFGFALLAAGEVARSKPRLDPRAAQALVGAGILVLYATPYGAHVLYDLISMRTASVLMVMVAVGALLLSLRHGPPTAVLGLAGGFATPALVGGDAGAIPLIIYLALLDIALFTLAQRRGWTWLAAAAILLSFFWTFYLTAAPRDDALAGGVFIVALAVAGSLVRPGPARPQAADLLRPRPASDSSSSWPSWSAAPTSAGRPGCCSARSRSPRSCLPAGARSSAACRLSLWSSP